MDFGLSGNDVSDYQSLFMELLLSAFNIREMTETSTNATEPLSVHLLL